MVHLILSLQEHKMLDFNIDQIWLFVPYVAEAPRIEIPPRSQVISAENTATFTCRAEGSPNPVIVWTLDGHDMPPDGRHSENFSVDGLEIIVSTLTISNLHDLDTAMVGCHADMPATTGLQLPGDSIEVPFTVLGKIIMIRNKVIIIQKI